MLWIPSLLVTIVLVGVTPMVVQKAAEASPKPVVVVTDSSWKGSPTGPDGWRTEHFDDSGWPAARTGDGPGEHYSPANMFGCSTQAEYIWGGTERICYMRKSFQVPARYRRAEIVVAADNVAEVFLNGLRVTSKDSQDGRWGHRGGATLVDLIPYLVEGTNVLAVRVEDDGSVARGFAAELRVDGTPFLPGRPASAWMLPKNLEQQLDDLARRLDADAFVVREAASAQLLALIEKHGELLRGKLEHLSRAGSAEVRSRVEQVLRALPGSFPDLDNKAGDDPRLVYLRLTLEQFESLLKAEDEAEVLILRYLVPFRALAAKHAKAMGAFLVRLLDGASPARAERVVGCISFLELRPLAPALADVVATRPRSTAAAAAASALGRLGDRSHEAVLKSVLQCGHLPTERAARHALMQLSSNESPPR